MNKYTKKKLVSIIIPVYNKSSLVEKCLLSVMKQTYKNIETIIIDDGSTDNSAIVIESFLKKNRDFKAKLYRKKNGGLASARNYGMNYIQGEFVFFLDPDDEIISNAIEKLLASSFEIDIVVGRYLYKNSFLQCWNQRPSTFKYLEGRKLDVKTTYKYLFQEKYGINACNKLYRTEFLKNSKIIFQDNNKIYAEDLLYNLKLLSYSPKIKILSDITYIYFQDENSITHTYQNKMAERYAALINDYNEFEYSNKDIMVIVICNAINCISGQEQSRLAIKREVSKFINKINWNIGNDKINDICKIPFFHRIDYFIILKLFNKISLLSIYLILKNWCRNHRKERI